MDGIRLCNIIFILLVKVDGCGFPGLCLVEGADLLDAVEGNPHTNLYHNYIIQCIN